AFENEVTKDYVADMLYTRVLKFPSGELLGLQWVTLANPTWSIGPADLTIDELKFFASHKTYYLMGAQAGATDTTFTSTAAKSGQQGGLSQVGDEDVGLASSGNGRLTGLK